MFIVLELVKFVRIQFLTKITQFIIEQYILLFTNLLHLHDNTVICNNLVYLYSDHRYPDDL